jgi:hypothetical protein
MQRHYNLSTVINGFNGEPIRQNTGPDAPAATLGHCLLLALNNADPRKRQDKKLKMYDLIRTIYANRDTMVDLHISDVELCKAVVLEHFPAAVAGAVHEVLVKGTSPRVVLDNLLDLRGDAPMKDANNLGLIHALPFDGSNGDVAKTA